MDILIVVHPGESVSVVPIDPISGLQIADEVQLGEGTYTAKQSLRSHFDQINAEDGSLINSGDEISMIIALETGTYAVPFAHFYVEEIPTELATI